MPEDVLYAAKIEGLEEAIKKIRRMEEDLAGRPVKEKMEQVIEAVWASVDEYIPRWRGDLAASLDSDVYADEGEGMVLGEIFSDLDPHVPQIERGTEPYWPNVSSPSLVEWAEEHGLTAYIVARAIAAKGIQPQKFFEKALEDNAPLVFALLDEAVAEVVRVFGEE